LGHEDRERLPAAQVSVRSYPPSTPCASGTRSAAVRPKYTPRTRQDYAAARIGLRWPIATRTAQPTAAAAIAAIQSRAVKPSARPVRSDAAVQRPAQQREFDPARDSGRSRQARHAPARVEADGGRQRNRHRVAERRGERDADNRVLQRRTRVAQRVIGGRIQAAERGGQQPHGRTGQNSQT